MIESDYVFLKPLQLPDAEAQVGRGLSSAAQGPHPGLSKPGCASGGWLCCVRPAGAIAFPIADVSRAQRAACLAVCVLLAGHCRLLQCCTLPNART